MNNGDTFIDCSSVFQIYDSKKYMLLNNINLKLIVLYKVVPGQGL